MKKVFRVITAVAVISLVFLTGIFYTKKQNFYSDDGEVHLCKVQRTDLDKSIYIIASVVSDDIEQVYSYVDAPVSEVKVNTGDMVRKGDVICTFDCTDLQKEYDNYMVILEQLINIDSVLADGFDVKASRERTLIDSQTDQLNKTIENYQKKYDEALALEEEYRSMYESAVKEQENLRFKIESIENNHSQMVDSVSTEVNFSAEDKSENNYVESAGENAEEIISVENSEESISDGNTDESIPDESNGENILDGTSDTYKNLNKLYLIVTEKKDSLYAKQQEMNKKTRDIGDTLNRYRKDLELLMIMKNSGIGETEKYFTPESRENMIASYTEKTDKLREMLDNSIVTADRDGIITDMHVTSNEYVSESMICRIQNPGKLHFSGYIAPENFSQISETSRLAVNLFDSEYIEREGKILCINDCFDMQKRGYEISFTIDDIEKFELYPGHEVSAKIVLESQPDTLTVPYDAVFEIDGQTYVRRYSESGDYDDVPVKKGLETSYYVAIESDDLSENDLVATEMLN